MTKAIFQKVALLAALSAYACASSETSAGEQEPRPVLSTRDILSWHYSLPKRFKDGDIEAITGAWAAGFKSSLVLPDGSREDTNRKDALAMFRAQINYNGQFASANGPQQVLVESITEKNGQAVVVGFWSGSWRIGTPESLADPGMSFDNKFKATWKKSGKSWRLLALVTFIKEVPQAEYERIRKADANLRQKHRF